MPGRPARSQRLKEDKQKKSQSKTAQPPALEIDTHQQKIWSSNDVRTYTGTLQIVDDVCALALHPPSNQVRDDIYNTWHIEFVQNSAKSNQMQHSFCILIQQNYETEKWQKCLFKNSIESSTTFLLWFKHGKTTNRSISEEPADMMHFLTKSSHLSMLHLRVK